MNALTPGIYWIGCGDSALMATGTDKASAQTMGAKAWGLLCMDRLGLPVPPAFVIGTQHCANNNTGAKGAGKPHPPAASPPFWQAGLPALEHASGLALGDARRPLLLSVRSGAAVSMPGMMETLLNIGLCDATVDGMLRRTGNPRLVWDAYRRLIAGYGEVVANVPALRFEEAAQALFGASDERELDFAELRTLTQRFLQVYAEHAAQPFPQCPQAQLNGAIAAVLASWQSAKAQEYRRLNGIADTPGTAVTVQSMVFGNAGEQSGAGVGFTRDPTTGEPTLWVDFLFNAQGEDVVSGRRSANGHDELAGVLPEVWTELERAARTIEQAFGDMQDFEFTVQEGRLYMLQSRTGKRTPLAAARIALDLLEQGLIDATTARARTVGLDQAALSQTRVVAVSGTSLLPLAHAASASSGVAIGEIALDEARAAARHAAGVAVVLVRRDAQTSDLAALELACGLLTRNGARTSHAAVVARQLGKVCLVGCTALSIDELARSIQIGDTQMHEGDVLTLDGNDGAIYGETAQTVVDHPQQLLTQLEALRSQGRGEE